VLDPRVDRLQRIAATKRGVVSLAGALPARELIPQAELARVLAEVARREEALQYGWVEGTASLRAWIADRLRARGAEIDADRVIVTAGAQQALAITASVLGGGDKTVTVGDATYPGALDAFGYGGLRAVERGGAIQYVMPGVSNPHGVDLGIDDAGGTIIADEAYTELRFDGRTPRPLLAGADARVWHIGTISKTIAPGLRVGWLIAPTEAHAAALEAKQAMDLQSASLSQEALARLLAAFDFDAHLARVRACYADRAAALTQALRRHAPALRFREPEGGFSVWAELDDAMDEVALLAAALREGVMVDPGSAFRPDRRGPLAVRIGFAHAAPETLVEGARRLARAIGAGPRSS